MIEFVIGRGSHLHIADERGVDGGGWARALCGWQGNTRASYTADTIEQAESELPWGICAHCRRRHEAAA